MGIDLVGYFVLGVAILPELVYSVEECVGRAKTRHSISTS